MKTRISVLRAANKLSEDADLSEVERESREYYTQALKAGEHIAYLVYGKEELIGAGGVSFYRVLPTYHNPSVPFPNWVHFLRSLELPYARRLREAMRWHR